MRRFSRARTLWRGKATPREQPPKTAVIPRALCRCTHIALKCIIKVENRTVHCTPCQTEQTGRGEAVREERQRGLDRFRALAPRSPARLARSNDPHPVQCNGIVVTPFPPLLSLFFFLSFSLSRFLLATLEAVFPPPTPPSPPPLRKKGWKRLCARGVAVQGVRGCLDVAYRPLSGRYKPPCNGERREEEGEEEKRERGTIVKSFSFSSSSGFPLIRATQ